MRHLETEEEKRLRHHRARDPDLSISWESLEMSESTKTLSKEDWILEALRVMDGHGVHEVKVSSLAAALGVTKGSFYWHFESREDLLASILQFWTESLVAQIDAEVGLQSDDPVEEFRWILGRIASGELNRHDPAIRTWAVFDPIAEAAVRRVDETRLEYTRGLFCRMGFNDREAELRSRLSYYYVVGEQVAALEARVASVEGRVALLTSGLGVPVARS